MLTLGLVRYTQHSANIHKTRVFSILWQKCLETVAALKRTTWEGAVFQQCCDRLFDMALSHAQYSERAGLLWFKAYTLAKQKGKKKKPFEEPGDNKELGEIFGCG